MAIKRSTDTFDPTRFDYSLQYDTLAPPTIYNIQQGGWYNYFGVSRDSVNRGAYGPVMTAYPITNSEYTLWLEGFYQFALEQTRKDAEAIREARKVLDENPQFARMLELHKKGLL